MRMIPVMRRGRLLPAVVAALVLPACGTGTGNEGGAGDAETSGQGVAVVATTMQLQDFARQVGGDRVEVTGILGPDDEPHEYEPRPSDADALAEAEVVLENGANLDGWLGDLLANAGASATRVTATKGIRLLPTDEEGFPGDPHVWHDPGNAKRMVDAVAAGLGQADPAGARTYRANAAAYKARLDEMAATIRESFAPVPRARRTIVTTHDALGYFARAYGVDVVGAVLPSVTTETETSGRQVRELVSAIRAQDVKAIFAEAGVDPKLERQIAREAGASVEASLYADVLGAPGSGAEGYVEAELANARAMAESWTR